MAVVNTGDEVFHKIVLSLSILTLIPGCFVGSLAVAEIVIIYMSSGSSNCETYRVLLTGKFLVLLTKELEGCITFPLAS